MLVVFCVPVQHWNFAMDALLCQVPFVVAQSGLRQCLKSRRTGMMSSLYHHLSTLCFIIKIYYNCHPLFTLTYRFRTTNLNIVYLIRVSSQLEYTPYLGTQVPSGLSWRLFSLWVSGCILSGICSVFPNGWIFFNAWITLICILICLSLGVIMQLLFFLWL